MGRCVRRARRRPGKMTPATMPRPAPGSAGAGLSTAARSVFARHPFEASSGYRAQMGQPRPGRDGGLGDEAAAEPVIGVGRASTTRDCHERAFGQPEVFANPLLPSDQVSPSRLRDANAHGKASPAASRPIRARRRRQPHSRHDQSVPAAGVAPGYAGYAVSTWRFDDRSW